MDTDRKIYIAEAVGGMFLLVGSLYWAYSLDGKASVPSTTGSKDDRQPLLSAYDFEQSNTLDSKSAATEPNSAGSTYKKVKHPEGKDAPCVELEKSTFPNPQTVFGASESLENPKIYVDVESFDIYILNSDGTYTKIGSFASNSMPGPEYNLVPVGTTVCEGVK